MFSMLPSCKSLARAISARVLSVLLATATAASYVIQSAWCGEASAGSDRYCAGVARRDITPRSLTGIYLGGYGFGPQRPAAGLMGSIFARAFAIRKGDVTVVFCAIDTQGHFLAYRNGRFGAADIRERVASDRGLPARNVIVASTHDHSAPDDTGIWGGVSDEYLRFVADRSVATIEAAIDDERPARLYAAETDVAGKRLLTNVLPSSYPMDNGLQILVAKSDNGNIIATLANFSAHSDILGSRNLMISPDWPGAAAARLEKFAPGSIGLVLLSSAGRSEPNTSETQGTKLTTVERYGHEVADLVIAVLPQARPIQGPIAVRETFIRERGTNPVLRRLELGGKAGFLESFAEKVLPLKICVLLGLKVYGTRGVDLIFRSTSAPYLTDGDVVGTVVSTVRIGGTLFAAVPVESYPETRLALMKEVRAQEYFLFSLADDQLGYDPPEWEARAVEFYSPYDEGLFMTSPKLGDTITHTLIEQAWSLGFPQTNSKPVAPRNWP
jgi:hypothetical protein